MVMQNYKKGLNSIASHKIFNFGKIADSRIMAKKPSLNFFPRFVMVFVCFATKTHAKTDISTYWELRVLPLSYKYYTPIGVFS